MRINNSCNLFIATGLALLVNSVAQAAPLTVIDTEREAAAATLAVLEIPAGADGMIWSPIDEINNALVDVRRVATYADLAGTPAGVTVPCVTSGSITARLAPNQPRLLLLRWNRCKEVLGGLSTLVHGPASLRLSSESLAPERTSAIRIGGSREFVLQIGLARNSYDFSLAGDIQLVSAVDASGNEVRHNAYEITGYSRIEQLDSRPGFPPTSVRRVIADRLQETVDETLAYATYGVSTIEQRIQHGSLRFVETNPAAQIDSDQRWAFRNYRRSVAEDLGLSTIDTRLSGAVQVRSTDNGRCDCLHGSYAFTTTAPLHEENFEEGYRSGELTINGTVVSRFSQGNVPQTFAVHISVENLGAFEYQGPSTRAALIAPAGCDAQ
jgi:hypothetical protein